SRAARELKLALDSQMLTSVRTFPGDRRSVRAWRLSADAGFVAGPVGSAASRIRFPCAQRPYRIAWRNYRLGKDGATHARAHAGRTQRACRAVRGHAHNRRGASDALARRSYLRLRPNLY